MKDVRDRDDDVENGTNGEDRKGDMQPPKSTHVMLTKAK
jgi:hypothetical protein